MPLDALQSCLRACTLVGQSKQTGVHSQLSACLHSQQGCFVWPCCMAPEPHTGAGACSGFVLTSTLTLGFAAGYSSCALALGLPEDGRLTALEGGSRTQGRRWSIKILMSRPALSRATSCCLCLIVSVGSGAHGLLKCRSMQMHCTRSCKTLDSLAPPARAKVVHSTPDYMPLPPS